MPRCVVLTWPAKVRRQLGDHTGADACLYARLSGRENLDLFAELNNLSRSEASHPIVDLTSLFGQVRTLSTGNIHRTFSWALRRTKITGTRTHFQVKTARDCKLKETKDTHLPLRFFEFEKRTRALF